MSTREQKNVEITEVKPTEPASLFENKVGDKRYELSNHLGNVLSVVTDRKTGGNEDFAPDVVAYNDYYPFGMPMPGRNMVGDYRYAFQGQEKDPETGKEAFELRLWDGRIGRWLTTDPAGQYSSPYIGMGNNPISGVDPDGAKNIRFDADGNYIGVDHDVWWHNLLFGNRGQYVDASGDWNNFRFNDSKDVDRFELKETHKDYLSGLDLSYNGDVEGNLKGKVNNQLNYMFENDLPDRLKYIAGESLAGGKLDFGGLGTFKGDKLTVFGPYAYNHQDAGNFLWGFVIAKSNLPFGYDDAIIGSEINAFWNGKTQNNHLGENYNWFTRITWWGDSAEDQNAIHRGFHYPYDVQY